MDGCINLFLYGGKRVRYDLFLFIIVSYNLCNILSQNFNTPERYFVSEKLEVYALYVNDLLLIGDLYFKIVGPKGTI